MIHDRNRKNIPDALNHTISEGTAYNPGMTKTRKLLPWLGLIAGLAIAAYFPAAEAISARQRQETIEALHLQDEKTEPARKEELLRQARSWNAQLAGQSPELPASEIWEYRLQLASTEGNAPFAALSIPAISLQMPVFHGTGSSVLSAGCGHLENTSLPVGGQGTHCVLSAHSGMQNMKAFDDLHQLQKGDQIGITVMDDVLCYEVTATETVLPDDLESIQIEPDQDQLTLVTCTPYGINTHRYLVHARRIPTPASFLEEKRTSGSLVSSSWLTWRNLPFLSGIVIVFILVISLIYKKIFRKQN